MTPRPRLCIMVTSAVTATTFLRGYLSFLREDGWDVTLVCSEGPGVKELAAEEGVPVHFVGMKREPSPFSDLRSLVNVFVLLRRMRPDALVYTTPKASLLGAIAGWAARVPYRAYELWGLRLETASGLSRRLLSALESVTARFSTAVIANGHSLAARAVELRVNGGKEVVVLGAGSSHGVDTGRYSRTATMPSIDESLRDALNSSGAPVVGFVGRLHPDKGIDTLFEALRICVERNETFQVLIVGDDEGADVSKYADVLARQVPVHVTGFVRDPRSLLLAMDLLALPSRREGFPNVVLEAAAMEVPAVVSDATGCVDSVTDGVTGLIAPVGDAHAWADALGRLLQSRGARQRMGASARAHVMTNFVPETVWHMHSRHWRTGLRTVQGATGD